MQFEYKETTVQLHGNRYKVCIPKYKFSSLHVDLTGQKIFEAMILSSKQDMLILAFVFFNYHNTENVLLYIPAPSTSGQEEETDKRLLDLDLVLTNHQMQFENTHWDEISNQLENIQFTEKVHEIDDNLISTIECKDYFDKDNRDYLDLYLINHTLFLCGSNRVYLDLAKSNYDMVYDDFPMEYGPHRHCCHMFRGAKIRGEIERDLILHLYDPESIQRQI